MFDSSTPTRPDFRRDAASAGRSMLRLALAASAVLAGTLTVRRLRRRQSGATDAPGANGSAVGDELLHFSASQLRDADDTTPQSTQWSNEVARLSRVAMMGELSGSLAHELNQPLTSILSNAQAAQRFLARTQPDLREVGDILNDIVLQGKRAGEVIQRVRAIFKQGDVQREILDMNDLLQDVLSLARPDLINQDVSVEVRRTRGLPPVWGDRVQLQQVLLNLIKNGCDAMDEAGRRYRRLSISIAPAAGAAGVRLSIKDRGCGVAHDRLTQVFEPFYTTKSSGMGLGLAVCRTIVQQHAGRLWLENNADRGVTAHLELYAARGEEPATAHHKAALDQSPIVSHPRRG